MDELIAAMSIVELGKFKDQYTDNESITKIVDGYIEVKTKQEAQVKAKADFTKVIAKLINKLPHPEDVHNVYMAWREVEVEDKSKEAEEVTIHHEDGEDTTEMRFPKHMEHQWVVELNKGFKVGSTGSSEPTASKRAITLNKRNGQALEFVGNFPSASKACEHLNLNTGGDSATRVLAREGYILDPYTGTDFATS